MNQEIAKKHGFTLIEMLLALVLTAMLAGALTMLTTSINRSKQQVQAKQAEKQPQWVGLAFDQMQTDLSRARYMGMTPTQDRLILLLTHPTPQYVAYRLVEIEDQTWLVRETRQATDSQANSVRSIVASKRWHRDPVANGIDHLQMGSLVLGGQPSNPTPRNQPASSMPTVIELDGRQIPLQPIPNQLSVKLGRQGEGQSYQKNLLLR